MITNFQIFESHFKIPSIKFKNKIAYHGSSIDLNDDRSIIRQFKIGYSDYDAIGFSTDEHIAEEFSDRYGDDNQILIVYKVKIFADKCAKIDMNIFNKITEEGGLIDLRDSISVLTSMGFDAGKTIGSVDRKLYDDYAIFYTENIEMVSAKIKINENGTDYKPLYEIQELINGIK